VQLQEQTALGRINRNAGRQVPANGRQHGIPAFTENLARASQVRLVPSNGYVGFQY
jgi:hypothetical protein